MFPCFYCRGKLPDRSGGYYVRQGWFKRFINCRVHRYWHKVICWFGHHVASDCYVSELAGANKHFCDYCYKPMPWLDRGTLKGKPMVCKSCWESRNVGDMGISNLSLTTTHKLR